MKYLLQSGAVKMLLTALWIACYLRSFLEALLVLFFFKSVFEIYRHYLLYKLPRRMKDKCFISRWLFFSFFCFPLQAFCSSVPRHIYAHSCMQRGIIINARLAIGSWTFHTFQSHKIGWFCGLCSCCSALMRGGVIWKIFLSPKPQGWSLMKRRPCGEVMQSLDFSSHT